MKIYYSGLLVIHPLISTSCSSSTSSVKNSKDYSPPLAQVTHTQAAIPAENIPDKKSITEIIPFLGLLWLWQFARLHITERSRRTPRWRFEDIALLKIIKTSALRLWNNRQPNGEIIRLEE